MTDISGTESDQEAIARMAEWVRKNYSREALAERLAGLACTCVCDDAHDDLGHTCTGCPAHSAGTFIDTTTPDLIVRTHEDTVSSCRDHLGRYTVTRVHNGTVIEGSEFVTYCAFIADGKRARSRRMFAVVSGLDALKMIDGSASPELLSFLLAI